MYIQISKFMGGNIFIFVLLMLLPLVDSSRPWKMLTMNLGGEANLLYSWTIFSSGVFVLIASVLSVFLIIQHLAVYKQPELWDPECFLLCLIRLPVFNPSQEQKFLIGLILMVPIYAVSSFLSLAYTEIAFVYEVLRDCYEAFAMYCFERYLIACLGGEENTIKLMETQSEISSSTPLLELEYADGLVRHPFPLNCLMKHWYLGTEFYESVKIAIVQYMILKTVCALLAIILELLGVYGEGKFKWNYGYPYLAVILNFSQTWALYCLVQFYSVTKHKLEPIKPLAKFLVFKSIVFLTWWQGVAIAFLFSIGTLKGHLAQLLKTRIQDYIICIEMGIAAVVHLYVFPAKPYHRGERCVRNVAVMTDYASLGTPLDPEEVDDCGRSPRVHIAPPDDSERLLSFPQSVRDVLFGSGEIVVDDVKFTVSHVVEPVERGIAKINKTLHQISENVKQHERSRRKAKDDTSFVPLDSWREECFDAHLVEGSYSDSGRPSSKKWQANAKSVGSRRGSFEFSGSRWL